MRHVPLQRKAQMNYIALDGEPRCNEPSPGGSLFCVRPWGHEHGHIWDGRVTELKEEE